MRKSSSYWAKHLAAIEESSISTSQYARMHGIKVNSLYSWRNRLKNKNLANTSATKSNSSSSLSVKRQTSRFVAMQIEQDIVSINQNACILKLSPTISLELNTLPDPKWLADIINLSKAM